MDALSEPVLVIVAIGWIAGFGLAAARMAKSLERLQPVWFVFGAILGPVALLVLHAAPPSRCRTCGTPTHGWARVCWWCHEDVHQANASVIAMTARLSRRGGGSASPIDAGPHRHPDLDRPVAIPSNRVEPPRRAVEEPTPTDARMPTEGTWTPWPDSPTRGATGEPRIAKVAESSSPVRTTRVPERTVDDRLRVIATALFVVGSARLEPGRRYGLALRADRLLILGPTDVDPSTVVLDRAAADVEVRAVEGRLVMSEPNTGSGLVLAFMSVAGATIADIAMTMTDAARTSRSA